MTLGGLEVRLPDGTERSGSATRRRPSGSGSRSSATTSSGGSRCAAGSGSARRTWPATSRRRDLPGLIALLGRNIEVARERDPLKTVTRLASMRPRLRPAQHAAPAPSATSTPTTTSATTSTGCSWTSRWRTRARSSSTPARASPTPSRRKYRRICDRLGLGAGDHVLEIGCGWGGFALHAARERGCRVTGVTISREQHDEAVARACADGRPRGPGRDRVPRLPRRRGRRTTHVVSIEMFEAVGE